MKTPAGENKFEYFENAPIILSILQFRYSKLETFNSKSLKKKGSTMTNEFPEVKERFIQQIRFTGNKPDGTTNVSLDDKEIDGVQFISNDKERVLIIGKDRFTLEKHGNYSGWDSFSAEGIKLWELFKEELIGVQLNGLSLRYVNRFNLPVDFKNLSDYFTTFIQSSTGEHYISSFQMKYTSTEPENHLTMHVGHVLEPPIEKSYPYLFDIDVIYSSDIQNEPDTVRQIFNILRHKKNFIFDDGLTEKSKALIR